MSGDIELDDIQVVNVTGKSHKDKPRHYKENSSNCWNPSLRVRVILIFVVIAILFVVGAIVLVSEMRASLEDLDVQALNKSINRFTMLFYNDIARLMPYTAHAAWQNVTALAAMSLLRNSTDPTPVDTFIQRYLNTSIVYEEDGTAKHVYRCGSYVNYWAIIHPKSFVTLWHEYHPGTADQYCTLTPAAPNVPAPVFPPEYYRTIVSPTLHTPEKGWGSIFSPMVTQDPMLVMIEAIMIPDEDGTVRNKTIYGFLVAAKTVKHHLSTFATNVPGCISMMASNGYDEYYDDLDNLMWNTTVSGSFGENDTFTGVPNFTIRNTADISSCPVRFCPAIPLFNDTGKVMTGYFRLCGQDPKKVQRNTCMKYRMDRPLSRIEEGTNPVIMLSVLVVTLMIILFILFIIFLDCAVLRRVVKLSESIRKQTLDHDIFREKEKKGPNSKKNDDFYGKTRKGGDEIKNLQHAVEQNTHRLRKRVEVINDIVRAEHQKILRHKQAMQLLSLWCDRNEFFPGLRANAALLRYEPTRSLDELLANPLAVEYLKSHCASDCTLENLFFLLDVSWLSELESAEDKEENAERREELHLVVSDTAKTIVSRYIAEEAPQQINISAATFKILRGKGDEYQRGMFNEAVGEVKLMLNTDILPRFHNSVAYTAMGENLFIDSFAYDFDSDMSTETSSTAGSVLSDEAGSGASGVVGFNFRNLYSFDGDTDLGSTCTNESSVIDDGATGSTITGGTGTARQTEPKMGTVTSSSSKKEGSLKEESTDTGTSDMNTTTTESKKNPMKVLGGGGGFKVDSSDSSDSSDLSDSSESSSSSSSSSSSD